METQRKVELLREQIEAAHEGGEEPRDFTKWRERTEAVLRRTLGDDHHLVEKFTEIRYHPAIWTDNTDFGPARRGGVAQGVAILEAAIFEVEESEPASAGLSAGGLHPWVAGAIVGLWDGGHRKHAVEEAARKVDLTTRRKLDVDLSGVDLMTQAFKVDAPTVDRPRLRFVEFEEGTDDWESAHSGAMHFGRGCMARIRNLLAHRDDEVTEQVALEYLAAFSLLARWVDDAEVVRAED